jgi:hypothetical protein
MSLPRGLRQVLRQHANRVGCDCGSDQWLEAESLHVAYRDDHEE